MFSDWISWNEQVVEFMEFQEHSSDENMKNNLTLPQVLAKKWIIPMGETLYDAPEYQILWSFLTISIW